MTAFFQNASDLLSKNLLRKICVTHPNCRPQKVIIIRREGGRRGGTESTTWLETAGGRNKALRAIKPDWKAGNCKFGKWNQIGKVGILQDGKTTGFVSKFKFESNDSHLMKWSNIEVRSQFRTKWAPNLWSNQEGKCYGHSIVPLMRPCSLLDRDRSPDVP